MLAFATETHVFWITSRAAGTVALLLASLSVCLGLAMGGRLLPRGTCDLRTTHEALSLATMAALAVHALSLLGDSYLRPSLADVTLLFASSYGQPWMTIGIFAGWLTVLLGLSYYLRGRIGVLAQLLANRPGVSAVPAGRKFHRPRALESAPWGRTHPCQYEW